MLPAELEDYWSRSRNRSMATAIYLIMKSFGISYFIATLYYDTNPHVTRVRSIIRPLHTRPEAASSIIEIGYVAAVKTIIILRLRAIYGYNRKVSILLYALIAIEMAVAIVAVVGILLFATIFPVQIPFPLPGCWWWAAPSRWAHLRDKVMLALWMIRVLATSIEAILMLIKLAEALNTERRFSEKSLLSAIGERRRLTPVLYIFYRDGALLIIPILVISTLGLVAETRGSATMGGVDWSMCLLITYQLCGSRMILNIRRVNGKLTGSMVPEYLSTIRFGSRGHIHG
ncbi:hypothetical protein NP233_g11446 [Leucocoprinus birnbaumii]|uniref:Uncharacterized protein n=1 Tax=Leucocoprinus birnbaumii TaxID=56174 RepID=A0AAD5VMI8_9AGAR|nr:hypothetical protein NP233_g11446 [Leucocoprinus birnbaumii]